MDQLSIYLAGNIQKGHEQESAIFWGDKDREFLQQELSPVTVSFLNPALRADDLSDQLSVFGRDMTQVYCSDLVFVDARERRGLGVGAEMMWAKINSIPLLTLAPRDSHYRKNQVNLLGVPVKNWVHPFVESLSDALVEDLSEAVVWIRNFLEGTIASIKGPELIYDAMKHYKTHQFENDLPMTELAACNIALQERMKKISSTSNLFRERSWNC